MTEQNPLFPKEPLSEAQLRDLAMKREQGTIDRIKAGLRSVRSFVEILNNARACGYPSPLPSCPRMRVSFPPLVMPDPDRASRAISPYFVGASMIIKAELFILDPRFRKDDHRG